MIDRNEVLTLKLTKAEKERVVELSARNGMTMSAYVRWVILGTPRKEVIGCISTDSSQE